MMTFKQFSDEVADALQESPGSVSSDTPLTDLRGFDSLGRLSLMVLMDEHFSYTLTPATLRNIRTVGELYALIGP